MEFSILSEFIKKQADSLTKLDETYPDRHKIIHNKACHKCPSRVDMDNGIEDEESKGIKDNYSKDFIAKESLFVCYCRPNKLCKGQADYHEIDQEFLNKLYL